MILGKNPGFWQPSIAERDMFEITDSPSIGWESLSTLRFKSSRSNQAIETGVIQRESHGVFTLQLPII